MKHGFSVPSIRIINVSSALIVLYYIIILVFGRSISIMSAFSWIVALLWFGITFSHIQSYVPNLAVTTMLLMVVIFYISMWDLAKYGVVSFLSTFFHYFTRFIPFYMLVYMYGLGYERIKKHIRLCLFIYTILAIVQCVLYFTAADPEYARNVVGTNRGYFTFIADAYGLCQAAAFLAMVGFIYMLKKGMKIGTIAFFILNNLVIILTQSTLMILCYIAALSYLVADKIMEKFLFGWIKGRVAKAVVRILICLLGIFLAYTVQRWLGNLFISFAEGRSGVVASRFRELGHLITTNNFSIDITARFSTYTTSIETALSHPFFGNYWAYDIGRYEVIGGHSEIIDTIARYGFPISIAFFALVYYFIGAEIRLIRIRIPGLMLLYTLFALVNPFNYSIAYFAVYYLVPLLVFVIENNEYSKNSDVYG